MLPELSKNVLRVVINTGNVLNINDIKKKAGQKTCEELVDCVKITLQNPLINNTVQSLAVLSRADDDLHSKITENERKDLKIGVKLFLNRNSVLSVTEAIESIFEILKIDCIDNLILAFQPEETNSKIEALNSTASESKEVLNNISSNGLIAGDNALKVLKKLWTELEFYALKKQIHQLGVADLDSDTLHALHSFAKVPPAITQINLSACCVVPPELQQLCKDKQIQLLTHSDPVELLTCDNLESLGISGVDFCWAVRHQVHIKCRGVLASKGYIVGLCRD